MEKKEMNISGKYLKAWKIEDKGNIKLVDLGDSTKSPDGTYNNFTWYRCLFVSSAAQLQINEKDTIEVKSGIITMEKYNDKWSPKIVVFEAEVVASTQSQEYSPKTDPKYNKPSTFTDDVYF
jgi:hypothetical protein